MKDIVKKILLLSFVSIFALLFFNSCETTETSSGGEVPNWVLTVPESDGTYEYFTASGTAKNAADAEKLAKQNLLVEISRMIGSSIKTSSVASQFGSTDSLNKFVEQEIRETSEAKIKKLKIKKRHIDKKNNTVCVYLLGAYNKQELTKEGQRLLALAQERDQSVSKYIKYAKAFELKKMYYNAALNYTQAACNALKFNVDNSMVKLNENIIKAQKALRKFRFELIDEKNKNYKKAKSDFKAVTEKKDKKISVFYVNAYEKDIPLRVSYSVKKNGSEKKVYVEKLTSNKNGFAQFVLELPQELCKGKINFLTDVECFEQAFEGLDKKKAGNAKDVLINELLHKTFYLEYSIQDSNDQAKLQKLKEDPRAEDTTVAKNQIDIFVKDYNSKNKLLSSSDTESFLADIFKKKI